MDGWGRRYIFSRVKNAVQGKVSKMHAGLFQIRFDKYIYIDMYSMCKLGRIFIRVSNSADEDMVSNSRSNSFQTRLYL